MATTWSYDAWVDEQAEKVRSAVARLACGGLHDAAVYVIPSRGATQGELTVETKGARTEMLDVLWFGAWGTNICHAPYSAYRSLIWHACRSVPICPTE